MAAPYATRATRSYTTPWDTIALADLASRAGMSMYHFARRFKALVGVTPSNLPPTRD